MHTFDKSSLKNLLKQLLDERLKRLEKRNEDQLKDLKIEKTSYSKQGEILKKLKLIKIKPLKNLFCLTSSNSPQKQKSYTDRSKNKTPENIHNQKIRTQAIKKKIDITTPRKTLIKNRTSKILLPHYLSNTRTNILKKKNETHRRNTVIQYSVQNSVQNSVKTSVQNSVQSSLQNSRQNSRKNSSKKKIKINTIINKRTNNNKRLTKVIEPKVISQFTLKEKEKPSEKKQKSNENLPAINIINLNEDYFKRQTINNFGPYKKNCLKHYEYYPIDLEEDPNSKLNIKILTRIFDNYINAEFSTKSINKIKSYASNSYIGMFKDYNEDRIDLVEIIEQPENKKNIFWPKMSYFAVFDGHCGQSCSNFLKNNLLDFIINTPDFPTDIKKSIICGFENAEKHFIKNFVENNLDNLNNSGSCALIIIITEKKFYIGNCGDCRAILSLEKGKKIKPLTIDHKPNNPSEYNRIIKAGANVFLDDTTVGKYDVENIKFIHDVKDFNENCNYFDTVYREYPSYLSVTRTIGDYKFKQKQYGSVEGSIIGIPEIFEFDYSDDYDFILMGCDGVYDFLNNNQIVDSVFWIVKEMAKEKNYNIHELTGVACDMVIKYAMDKRSEDNLSCIIIGLNGLDKFIKELKDGDKKNKVFGKL